MSLINVPSKVEVMGWTPQSLADYMKKLKLSGCDKAVMKSSITGAQFIQMTACDLAVFPSLYIPIITKIHSELNKPEQKKTFGLKLKLQKPPKQVFVQEQEVWDSDEFDSDNDYEGPDHDKGQDDYICAVDEPQTAEQQQDYRSYDGNYNQSAAADLMKPPRPPRGAKLQDGHRDHAPDPPPAERISKPPYPHPPKLNHTPQRPFKASASQPAVPVDRSKKPAQPVPCQRDIPKLMGSAAQAPGSFSSRPPPQRSPRPSLESKRSSKPPPPPPVQTQLHEVNNLTPDPRKGVDPGWYGGKMSRREAEVALREVNKDGAFVVRDSSKGSAEHPYTLMLLNQGKVYNIKIRNQGNSVSLGSGLRNTKSFPGVKELITHHTYTPLLLIDATDQSCKEQPQCFLQYPAGR